MARLLWEGRGYAGVEYSFISLAEPSVPAALDRAATLGARRIVVAPYFLFSGVLPDRVTAQARGVSHRARRARTFAWPGSSATATSCSPGWCSSTTRRCAATSG